MMATLLISKIYTFLARALKNIPVLQLSRDRISDVNEYDHPLLEKCTDTVSYATSYATYPSIRSFYHPHAHADKLSVIADLPLLVVIHGLGGSLPQFAPLLGSLVNLGPCFGIELPGHGLSGFAPTTSEAYSFEALVDLWKTAIDETCQKYNHRKVVLIGHSLGCSIMAVLASTSTAMWLNVEVVGAVAICPKSTPPTEQQTRTYRRLLSLPNFILEILRWFDRFGQEGSKSVKRFVGNDAGIDLKRLQLRLNKQFRTTAWKQTSLGILPRYDSHGNAVGGIPGRRVWEELRVPLFIIAGEGDQITRPKEATDLLAFVKGKGMHKPTPETPLPVENGDLQPQDNYADEQDYGVKPSSVETQSQHALAVKAVVLPSPASHALMYDHSTYRTVAGLIEDFLSKHVSNQLELGWQLQQLATSGKWDVKNLEKWRKVIPVSAPIDGGLFRALKTLREQDAEHTPAVFVHEWKDEIFAVIDISHDSPVYDTQALEKGGIQYHKFPTVSKVPPTIPEVESFIALIDRLRADNDKKHPYSGERPAIGIHCHYGYNRTGFFIVCYLVESRGYTVQDAIDAFAKAKPPGIKHDHFIDTLFVRYCVGLRRSSTFR